MKIELKPGEQVTVCYEGTDGEVVVSFQEEATVVVVDGELVHTDPFATWDDTDDQSAEPGKELRPLPDKDLEMKPIVIDLQGTDRNPIDPPPAIGATGKGDMRTTAPFGEMKCSGAERWPGNDFVIIDRSTYELMVCAVVELEQWRRGYKG